MSELDWSSFMAQVVSDLLRDTEKDGGVPKMVVEVEKIEAEVLPCGHSCGEFFRDGEWVCVECGEARQ